MKFLGRAGRQEDQGRWRISNGELIAEIRNLRGYQWSGGFVKWKIMSVRDDLVILRTPVGRKEELRHASIPSQLPPILQEGELNRAIALVGPTTTVPIERSSTAT
jgi:hypothetical protein